MSERAQPARDDWGVWDFHQPYFDVADDPMWIEDRRDRRILALNDACCDFFEVRRDGALGRQVDVVADVSIPRPGVGHAARWAFRVADEPRILDVRLHPMEFALRPAVLVVGRDLTPLVVVDDDDDDKAGHTALEVLAELLHLQRALRHADGPEVDSSLERAVEAAADMVLHLGVGPLDPGPES